MFVLKLNTDHEAFDGPDRLGNVACCLHVLSIQLLAGASEGQLTGKVKDSQRNTVGSWELEP